MSWIIYSKDNEEKCTVNSIEYNGEFMGECSVTVSVSSPEPINFVIGDYLDYRGDRFTLYNVPSELKQARRDTYGAAFVYDDIKFESLSYELTNCQFLDVVSEDNNVHYTKLSEFTFYASSVKDLAERLKANLDRIYTGTSAWTVSVDPSVDDVSKNISISNITCWDALALANSEWDLNFTIVGRTITIGAEGIAVGSVFKYGKGNGLLSLQRTADSDQAVITRLRAYGSTKNMPTHYYAYLQSKPYFDATTVDKNDSWIKFTLGESTFPTTCFTVNADDSAYPLEKRYLVTYELDGVSCKGMFVKPDTGNEWATASTATDTAENVAAFIAKYDAGNTRVYITNGINKNKVPESQIDRGTSTLPNNYSVTHLMLPGFPSAPLSNYDENGSTDAQDPYLDSDNASELGILEGTVFFDGSGDLEEIYPSIEDSDKNYVVYAEEIEDNGICDDGKTPEQSTFTVKIPDIGFNISEYVSGDSAKISFTSGKCTGREFTIKSTVANDEGGYTLTLERYQDTDLDLWFPYKDYNIGKNSTFVLTDIYMPDIYIQYASERLLDAAKKYLAENDYTRYTYEPKIDNIYIQREYDSAEDKTQSLYYTLKEGQLLLFEDDDLDIEGSVFIDSLNIKEGSAAIPEFDITLREDKQVGTIQRIQNSIDSLKANGGGTVNTEQIRSLISTYGSRMFISKVNDDTAEGNITFKKDIEVVGSESVGGNVIVKGKATAYNGMQFTETYTEGIVGGTGASVDKDGNGEMESLILRRFLEVPELRYNRVEVRVGDKWRAPGAGIIEEWHQTDETHGWFLLKLEEGEIGAVFTDAICMGIYHSETSSQNETENGDDGKGNRTFAGFYTTYFRITKVEDYTDGTTTWHNKKVTYALRPTSTSWTHSWHPCAYMTFVCYGKFGDCTTENIPYQTSVYETTTYTRMLVNQNTWEQSESNIGLQYGDMTNFQTAFAKDLSGYSMYMNNLYLTGSYTRVKADGTVVLSRNFLSDYKAGDKVSYYDEVSYNGSTYLCINEDGTTTTPPSDDWMLTASAGTSVSVYGRWQSGKTYPKGSLVSFSNKLFSSNADTTEPPYPLITDKNGNYVLTTDGYYIISKETANSSWDILIDIGTVTSGKDGADSVIVDTDNEMDSVACDADGKVLVGNPLKTNVYILKGNEKYAFTSYSAVSSDSNVTVAATPSSDKKNLALSVTVGDAAEKKSTVTVTLASTINGKSVSGSVVFTVNKVCSGGDGSNAVIYQLHVSANKIGVKKDGTWTTETIRVGAVKYDGATTTDALSLPGNWVVKYSIDGNDEQSYNLYTDVTVKSVVTQAIVFSMYDGNGVLVDRETIPVVTDGSDGEKGSQGDSFSMLGSWYTGLHVPYLGVVTMGSSNWCCKKSGGSDNPPCWCYTSEDGSRLKTSDGGYILTGSLNSNDYYLFTSDGANGEDSIVADLDNEMDSVPCDADGNVKSGLNVVTTNCYLLKGNDRITIDSYTIETVSGISNYANLSSDKMTLNVQFTLSDSAALSNQISITLVNGTNSRKLTFTANKVVSGENALIYSLAPSLTSIAVKKDGTWSSNTVSCKINQYDGKSVSVLTEIPSGYSMTYSLDGGTAQTYTIGYEPTIKGNAEKNVKFSLLKGTTVIDVETIPITNDGEDGKDGIGISGVTEYYAKSSSDTTAPTSWSTTIPTLDATKKYLWNYEKIAYTEGNPSSTTPAVIAIFTKDGKGISSVTERYLASASSSGITRSSSGWTTTMQYPDATKKYLWNYETVSYTEGSDTYTEPAIIGNYAKDGEDGSTPYIKDGTWWIGSTDTKVKAEGEDGITPYIGSNGNWWIGTTDTGTKAEGADGTTPSIGDNGNWWIGTTDTGRTAKGDDGKSPYISDTTGTWYEYDSDKKEYTDTGIKAEGQDGEGFSYKGHWSSSATYSKNDVVVFGGNSMLSLVGNNTTPPYGLIKSSGKYITTDDGYYIHTGVINSDYWNVFVPAASNGKDGKDGNDGKDGTDGTDGIGIRYISTYYILTDSATEAPSKSATDWSTIHPTWENGKYIWSYTHTVYSDGTTSDSDVVCLSGSAGNQGYSGCVVRTTEYTNGVSYRNDENLADRDAEGNVKTKYIDVVWIKNSSAATGYNYYKCEYHPASFSASGISYTSQAAFLADTTNWTKADDSPFAHFGLIVAKNAKLEFINGNELDLLDGNGNITAGINGGSGVQIWAGGSADDPTSAKFRVKDDGSLYASNATVQGTITAKVMYTQYNTLSFDSAHTLDPSTDGTNVIVPNGDTSTLKTLTLPSATTWNGLTVNVYSPCPTTRTGTTAVIEYSTYYDYNGRTYSSDDYHKSYTSQVGLNQFMAVNGTWFIVNCDKSSLG